MSNFYCLIWYENSAAPEWVAGADLTFQDASDDISLLGGRLRLGAFPWQALK